MPGLGDVAVNLATLYILADRAMEESRPAWLPCRAGCAWCCWSLNVLVTWAEAYYVALTVARWTPEARASLARQARAEVTMLLGDPTIARIAAAGTGIAPDDFSNLKRALKQHLRPCPLLDRATGRCRVYQQRFLACRLYGQTAVQEQAGPSGYYCQVVAEDVTRQPEAQFYDAAPFMAALYRMTGAPTVYAMPVCFWLDALAQGPENGETYSLAYPDPLFERFLSMYAPLEFDIKTGDNNHV